MSETKELIHEHEVILHLLGLLETACDRIDGGGNVETSFFRGALNFLRQFADKCHHGKEEKVLFPALIENGLPATGGPVQQMLSEHDRGRGLLKQMQASLEPVNLEKFTEAARGYISLLRAHIAKENHVLFPLAKDLLNSGAQGQVKDGFTRVELETMGEGMHEKLMVDLRNLEKILLANKCERTNCQYNKEGSCSVGLNPHHPECSFNAEHSAKFICASCDFCGKEATNILNVNFQCVIGPNKEKRPETTCYCVCNDCRNKYIEMVDVLANSLPGR
ncbi:MAG: hemerythrin domain-containing protein [Bacillota bacterium]